MFFCLGWGIQFGNGAGGDILHPVLLDQPLVAVVEGGEGNVAELAVGGVEDRGDLGLFEVGGNGLNQSGIEFLGQGLGVVLAVA